ncbi:pilus assembly protein N-terminal domain-containing protein [Liberibacter crescens]|uniref:pilus assembly protein N-terminal domain-containing protein n=1 Tax=Liberibacter crescens TaxID=1273132 RepID=UPI0005A0BDFB|nr:pilus assembly protein N-terminal domain-containing protein [Liberibacter crescens]AMC13425.1 hypothetical protein RL73_06540 [Liberibacter crescens]
MTIIIFATYIIFYINPALAENKNQIHIPMGESKIIKFDMPISKVIIGDVRVLDAIETDPQTIVLTTKNYGSTNLVILDKEGNIVIDKTVIVTVSENNTVRIYRQTKREVFSCNPNCESNEIIPNTVK